MGLENYSILTSHVLVPPAMEALLSDPENVIDGFLAAGHVCTIMGLDEYYPIVDKFRIPVVVTGFDERFIYVHDPYIDDEAGKTVADCINMPILRKDFERMARYGKSAQRAVLIIRRLPGPDRRRRAPASRAPARSVAVRRRPRAPGS